MNVDQEWGGRDTNLGFLGVPAKSGLALRRSHKDGKLKSETVEI